VTPACYEGTQRAHTQRRAPSGYARAPRGENIVGARPRQKSARLRAACEHRIKRRRRALCALRRA